MKTGLWLFVLFISLSFIHPIHISLTNIDYNENTKSFTIAIKIFTDDFESILKKKYGIDIKMNNEFDENSKKYINKYITENFDFTINNKKVAASQLNFLRKETNFEAVWLYYELKNINNIKSIKLRSSFLDDLYPDQKNLLIFNYKKVKKAFKFKKSDEIAEFEI